MQYGRPAAAREPPHWVWQLQKAAQGTPQPAGIGTMWQALKQGHGPSWKIRNISKLCHYNFHRIVANRQVRHSMYCNSALTHRGRHQAQGSTRLLSQHWMVERLRCHTSVKCAEHGGPAHAGIPLPPQQASARQMADSRQPEPDSPQKSRDPRRPQRTRRQRGAKLLCKHWQSAIHRDCLLATLACQVGRTPHVESCRTRLVISSPPQRVPGRQTPQRWSP